MPNISLPAHVFFQLGPFPITDGILGGIVVSLTLIAFSILAVRKFSLIPNRLQMALELVVEYIMDQLTTAFGSEKKARAFFPLFFTILLFITVANQFTLIPFIFQVMYEGNAILRQPTSDFAQPLTLALIVVVLSHVLAFKISPIKHLSNFFAFGKLLKVRSVAELGNAFVDIFIGILNIIGEIAKVVSLAARLFGNVFAGNVMVAVIASLSIFTSFIVPIPFIFLSIFSGFIQAFVFMLLSIQFIAITIDGATPEKVEEIPNPEVAIAG